VDRRLESHAATLSAHGLELAEHGQLERAVRQNLWGIWPYALAYFVLNAACAALGPVDRRLPLAGAAGGAPWLAWAFPAMASVAAAIAARGSHARNAASVGSARRRGDDGGDAGHGLGDRMIGPGRTCRSRVKLRVFLRSLLLQASWNPKGMQNLGLVYALYPALEVLYPEPAKRREAVQRHLTFFNTHRTWPRPSWAGSSTTRSGSPRARRIRAG
jgi:hypothetical protein